jgi:hypothetical protein
MPIVVDDIADLDVDDDLSELLGLCDQLLTEEQMRRRIILETIDPIIPCGDLFTFKQREPSELFISPEVPKPFDRVDLAVAWQVAQADARACRLVLERDHSLAASLRVYRNTIAWLRFLSVRFPNEQQRAMFERALEERMLGLAALKAKARMRFRLEMMEELENV